MRVLSVCSLQHSYKYVLEQRTFLSTKIIDCNRNQHQQEQQPPAHVGNPHLHNTQVNIFPARTLSTPAGPFRQSKASLFSLVFCACSGTKEPIKCKEPRVAPNMEVLTVFGVRDSWPESLFSTECGLKSVQEVEGETHLHLASPRCHARSPRGEQRGQEDGRTAQSL